MLKTKSLFMKHKYACDGSFKHSEAIFNKRNTKRRSTPLEENSHTVQKLIQFLRKQNAYNPESCKETEFVGIRSLPGCTEQPLHIDVNDQEACFRAKNFPCLPRSVIWCFNNDTKLNIRPPCDADLIHTIVMKTGDQPLINSRMSLITLSALLMVTETSIVEVSLTLLDAYLRAMNV